MANKRYSSKCVTVIDNGLFCSFARKLAESFGQVNYWTPWQRQSPKSDEMRIGDGIEGIERIDHWEEVLDETDLFVFPDNYLGPLQVLLDEKLGKNVWGSRYGEQLELDRPMAKKLFKKLGLPVNESVDIKGMDKLREYLKKNEDQWIKISHTRGDCETFNSINYELTKRFLDKLEFTLGANSEDKLFSIEKPLPEAIESGIDTYCVDGEYPDKCLTGIETKNLGWVGKVSEYAKLPPQLTDYYNAISNTMKANKYRNFTSSENRILVEKPHVSYMIDATQRVPAPPGGLWWKMLDNLDDIVWFGAQGKLIQPKFNAKYGCSVVMRSANAEEQALCIQYPDRIDDHVKLYNMAIIKGQKYILPDETPATEVGEVVGTGDTMDDAIDQAYEYCEQVKAIGIDFPKNGIDKAKEHIQKLKDMGIDLS